MKNSPVLYKIALIECPVLFEAFHPHFKVQNVSNAVELFSMNDNHGFDVLLCSSQLSNIALLEFLKRFSTHPELNLLPLYFVHSDKNCKEKAALCQAGVIDCFSYDSDFNEIALKIINLLNLFHKRTDSKIKAVKEQIKHSIEKMNYMIKDKKTKMNENQNLYSNYDLTEREIQIIELILENSSNKEIADKLDISIHTVSNHIKNIFSKLKINKRIDLIQLFLKS